jgi:GNAT superfamily N-acetyltransferase
MELCVRPAVRGDAVEVCRVCASGWRAAYEDVLPAGYVRANLERFYRPVRVREEITGAERGDRWLVAERDGVVVGAGRGHRVDAATAEVFVLYVAPAAQGEGVGSQLLATLSDGQRERGAEEQVVDVFAPHEAARGFYRSKGFAVDSRRPAAVVDCVDPACETVRLSRSLR